MASYFARLWLLASVLVLTFASAPVRADVAAPPPLTIWNNGQEPESNTLVAAGAAISAVIVAAGLIVGRWPVRSSVGRIVVASLTGLSLLAVWGVAGGTILQAERDRGMWKQWEIRESNRRSNWRPPPNFDGPPEPVPPPISSPSSQPAPESTEPSAPTIAAEPVQ